MYFCVQTHTTHFQDQTKNFSTCLQTVLSDKLYLVQTCLSFLHNYNGLSFGIGMGTIYLWCSVFIKYHVTQEHYIPA